MAGSVAHIFFMKYINYKNIYNNYILEKPRRNMRAKQFRGVIGHLAGDN